MGRVVSAIALLIASLVVLAAPAEAGILSKSYEFKPGVTLQMSAPMEGESVRADHVLFHVPTTTGSGYSRTGGPISVEVALSNTGEKSRKVGIGIALFDADNRLVGVASGGSSLVGLKPGRQKTYKLVFGGIGTLAHTATTFQITIETGR